MSEGPELALMYFPGNYRWSIALLLALGGAPWGGAEMGEIHRIGLRLKDRVGDDQAWYEEWTGMAAHLSAKVAPTRIRGARLPTSFARLTIITLASASFSPKPMRASRASNGGSIAFATPPARRQC